ncbi:putative Transcription factor, enhancer of yellow 2 protein, partial [Trachipleistophora hominis]
VFFLAINYLPRVRMLQTSENLISEETKNKLLNLLDLHMKRSGFHDKIMQKMESLKINENINIEALYKEIYDFMTANMPEEVQDAFFEDVRRIMCNERQ